MSIAVNPRLGRGMPFLLTHRVVTRLAHAKIQKIHENAILVNYLALLSKSGNSDGKTFAQLRTLC